jgi:hypothetical protein
MTEKEKFILKMTADLWNKYQELEPRHPSELRELELYLHQIQLLIAGRVAKRIDPEVWA